LIERRASSCGPDKSALVGCSEAGLVVDTLSWKLSPLCSSKNVSIRWQEAIASAPVSMARIHMRPIWNLTTCSNARVAKTSGTVNSPPLPQNTANVEKETIEGMANMKPWLNARRT